MTMVLKGEKMKDRKIALITGGARVIGFASAKALWEDGFVIILADINRQELAKATE